MVHANTTRKFNSSKQRFAMKGGNTMSWTHLHQKICAMANNQASPKELSEVIAKNDDFAAMVVSQAGCGKTYAIEKNTIIQAILLLGVDRLCELAFRMV